MWAGSQDHGSIDELHADVAAASSRLAGVSLEWFEKQLRFATQARWNQPHSLPAWFELCSYDGYKREAVLRGRNEPPTGALFWALAIRRLNDWVPQVRAAARDRLPVLARRANPVDVAEAVWRILQDWQYWVRLSEADRHVVVDLFSSDGVARDLVRRVRTATTGAGARVLAQLGCSPVFDSWRPEFALHAAQPSVRVRALRSLFERQVAWVVGHKWAWTDKQWCKARYVAIIQTRELALHVDELKLLEAALRDNSRFVRGVAGEFIMKRLLDLGDAARGLAERLAADPHPSVADQGRYALEKLARG